MRFFKVNELKLTQVELFSVFHLKSVSANVSDLFFFFPNSSFSIAEILKQHNFKVIYSAVNKLPLSKLKDPRHAKIFGNL